MKLHFAEVENNDIKEEYRLRVIRFYTLLELYKYVPGVTLMTDRDGVNL